MIYLFYGPDGFNRRQAVQSLMAQMPAEVADFNLTVLQGRQATLEALKTACLAYPMLHSHRLVIAHNLIKQQRTSQARDTLREIIKTLPATTNVVFNEDDVPDLRLALVKDIQKSAKQAQAHVQVFDPLEGAALQQWIVQHIHDHNASITPPAVQRLIEYVGSDTWTLHNEIVKLAVYKGSHTPIQPDDIETLVSDETEANLFAFIDALCERKGPLATQRFHALIADGAAALYILSMIARQVRLMLYAHHASSSAPNDLAQIMGQRPFIARKAAQQARLFSLQELHTFHHEVLRIDHQIKTGVITDIASLETLIATFGYKRSPLSAS